MNWKVLPYIIIFIFCVVVGILRLFIIAEWTPYMHVVAFILQLVIMTSIWVFVKLLSTYLDKRLPFEKSVAKRTALQIGISLLVFIPVLVWLLYKADDFHFSFFSKPFIAVASMLLCMMVIFLNLGYTAIYFFRQWQQSVEERANLQVEAAEMEKEKSIMRYHHLKNQVNPHFLFNTFSSLDGLIQTNPELASAFVRHLSKVYRYVLEHKEREVVSLQTETDFIQHYISLLQIRYQQLLTININISPEGMEKGIVMVTLQMLIDNAIKHNSLQADNPLHINIWDEQGYLHVLNNKQLRKQIETSNKQGLQQLRELYAYLTPAPTIINDTDTQFEINLPLL